MKKHLFVHDTPVHWEVIKRQVANLLHGSLMPLHGSHAAVPIAMSVAKREYHYPLEPSWHYGRSNLLFTTGYLSLTSAIGVSVAGAFTKRGIQKNVPDECVFSCQCSTE